MRNHIDLYMDCPKCGKSPVEGYLNTPEIYCNKCEYLIKGLE